MRRITRFALAAGVVAALAGAPAATAAANYCNGTVDTDCDYYDSLGRLQHCTLWVNGGCPSVSISITKPRGTCDGAVDIDCTDPVHCNLWVYAVGCVIG